MRKQNNPLMIIKENGTLDNNPLSVEMVKNDYDFLVGTDLFSSDSYKAIDSIPISDINLLSEMFIGAKRIITSGDVSYIADLDSLPSDVKEKLADGTYTIGESKQVDGNLRAVVMDENGVRTKDITLKEVVNTGELTDVARSIGIQLQMRQIMNKLNEIGELQVFLVERNRDSSILVPF